MDLKLRIPPALVARLKARAKKNHRSVNAELTVIIEEALK